MALALTPPLNGYSKSVQLWYVTNFLSGIAWASFFFIANPDIESITERLIRSLLIAFCGAVFSVITIPAAMALLPFIITQRRLIRLLFTSLTIRILWALINLLVTLFSANLLKVRKAT